jgi:hypothetical protein
MKNWILCVQIVCLMFAGVAMAQEEVGTTGADQYTLGFLGVGTDNPKGSLHIKLGTAGVNASSVANNMVFESNGKAGFSFLTPGGGNDGKIHFSRPGSVGDGTIAYRFDGDSGNGQLSLGAGKNEFFHIVGGSGGEVGIGTSNPQAKLDVAGDIWADGQLSASVVEIRGADLAEGYRVSGKDVKPGMVVRIDPHNPGNMIVSSRAYDNTVAGVISGAGTLHAGIVLGKSETNELLHPIALAGRVYCYVDTTNGPVKPGDLLTTSIIPGNATKATSRRKGQGAILGKAMSSLEKGSGLVLVLVSLQ